MRIQFCHNCTEKVIAEFEVNRAPTAEESSLIYGDIDQAVADWEEEHNGDFEEFDFWQCCHDAAAKRIDLLDDPVVKTFYV